MVADAVLTEMDRAEDLLKTLVGEEIDTLTVNSLDTRDAPFLGLVVSKLSPIIGNLLERRITDLLTDHDAVTGLRWKRQDPDFPDALLVDRLGRSTDHGFEVKAWYALSTELTGRFRESVNLLHGRGIRVVIIAWHMSHIVYGTPRVIGVFTEEAVSLAEARDLHYHNPPDYLCVEPRDTTARTRNLRQTNVSGYKWQDTIKRFQDAQNLVNELNTKNPLPHTPQGQALVEQLMNRFKYRLDTNFAKVDRIDHSGIEKFKSQILSTQVRDRPLKEWMTLLKALNNLAKPSQREYASGVLQQVYKDL